MTCDQGRVLIAGAGPVGLSMALACAQRGLRSVVLEADDAPSGEGSKSICIQKDVLQIFDRLGCAGPMLDLGVSWTLGRTYFGDTELFQTRLGDVGKEAFPPFINLQQFHTERFLRDAIAGSGLVDIRWGHRVTGLTQGDEGVEVAVASPGGGMTLRGAYLVGCDGPRSTVRHLLGIGFPGHSHPDQFLIADIRADLPFPNERRFFFDPPFNPGRQVLVHQQPEKVWRIDWQVPPDVDAEEERRTGRLDDRIRAVIGSAVEYELVWLTQYRFHQRVAQQFRAGRVFLAGDAAHLMSPFGARGMNSGVQDAENLAWKLWLVLGYGAPDALLDTYDTERRAAAEENLRITDATMRFMVPPSPWRRQVRNAILRGSLHARVVRRFVNSGKLSTPHVYRHSPIVDGASRLGRRDGPVPGSLAPDAPCRVVADPSVTRVRQLFGPGFLALVFPQDAASARRFLAVDPVAAVTVPTRAAVVAPPGRTSPPASPPAGVVLVSDAEAKLRGAYRPSGDMLYLVRPDGHIAARREAPQAADVAAAVDRATAVGMLPRPVGSPGYTRRS